MPSKKPRIAPRKPPAALPLEVVEQFVKTPEDPVIQTPERRSVPTPKRSKGKPPKRSDVQTSERSSNVTRQDGRELRRLTAYLHKDTFRRLKVRCAELDKELSEALEEAAQAWLGKGSGR